MPRSEACIMSVSVSADASSRSVTLICLSAARAALLNEPAARTQIQHFRFVFMDFLCSVRVDYGHAHGRCFGAGRNAHIATLLQHPGLFECNSFNTSMKQARTPPDRNSSE